MFSIVKTIENNKIRYIGKTRLIIFNTIPDACNILNHPRLQFGWTDVTRFGSSPSEPANIF